MLLPQPPRLLPLSGGADEEQEEPTLFVLQGQVRGPTGAGLQEGHPRAAAGELMDLVLLRERSE